MSPRKRRSAPVNRPTTKATLHDEAMSIDDRSAGGDLNKADIHAAGQSRTNAPVSAVMEVVIETMQGLMGETADDEAKEEDGTLHGVDDDESGDEAVERSKRKSEARSGAPMLGGTSNHGKVTMGSIFPQPCKKCSELQIECHRQHAPSGKTTKACFECCIGKAKCNHNVLYPLQLRIRAHATSEELYTPPRKDVVVHRTKTVEQPTSARKRLTDDDTTLEDDRTFKGVKSSQALSVAGPSYSPALRSGASHSLATLATDNMQNKPDKAHTLPMDFDAMSISHGKDENAASVEDEDDLNHQWVPRYRLLRVLRKMRKIVAAKPQYNVHLQGFMAAIQNADHHAWLEI